MRIPSVPYYSSSVHRLLPSQDPTPSALLPPPPRQSLVRLPSPVQPPPQLQEFTLPSNRRRVGGRIATLTPERHWFHTIMDDCKPWVAMDTNSPDVGEDEEEITAAKPNKASLAFILSSPSSSGSETESDQEQRRRAETPTRSGKRRRIGLHDHSNQEDNDSGSTHVAKSDTTPADASSPGKKGSKYCIVEGCMSRAKHARRCWKHGGSVKCKVPDCINRAKSKGVCWSHGGGTICSHPGCDTIAVSHGFCWAHGGGKRCQVNGCHRPAYERTENHCTTHYKQRLRAEKQEQRKYDD